MNWLRRIRKRKRNKIGPGLLLLEDEFLLKSLKAMEAESKDVPFKEEK